MLHYIKFSIEKHAKNSTQEQPTNKRRVAETIKGMFLLPLSYDFDEPLEDMSENYGILGNTFVVICRAHWYLGVIQKMESHQDMSSFSSLQLLEELENLIALESDKNGNPWIRVTKLAEVFYKKYGVSLEEVAKVQGYKDGLSSFLTSSRRFSIYATPIPQEFYVALLQAVVPGFHQSQASSIKYTIKRPWKVDGSLVRMLQDEGTEEILPSQAHRISEYQPILISEIKSVTDLKIALREIINSMTENHPKKIVTIALLSKKFHTYYKQPIRTVIRSVCPDLKLIELLQTIPSLHVQKVDNDWQMAVEADLDEVTGSMEN